MATFLISTNQSAPVYGKEHDILPVSETNISKMKILASFFPIYEFVKNIGGDRIDLRSIIPLDAEPHDWEPTFQQIKEIHDADLIVYNGIGFESWITKIQGDLSINKNNFLNFTSLIQNHSEYNDVKGIMNSDTLRNDPHIWLDPILVKSQLLIIGEKLSDMDPENKDYYLNNTNSFINKIDRLDKEIKKSLSNCDNKDFISMHNAFNYFSKRYGLNYHTVFGSSPEGDVSPQKLKKVIDLTKHLNITTIYTEDLADPRLAETIASEISKGRVLYLSPLERISETELNSDIGYIEKMKQNLENLKIGMSCK